MLFSSTVNAAYYFQIDNNRRLIVSDDTSIAVLTTVGDDTARFKFSTFVKDQIDDSGRPYSLFVYMKDSCNDFNSCTLPLLVIKKYSDTQGGADISYYYKGKNTKTLISELTKEQTWKE